MCQHECKLQGMESFYFLFSPFLAGAVKVCALKLTHIGKNYPCLQDPNYGPVTPDNSSAIQSIPNVNISFLQLANWGKYFPIKLSFSYLGIYNPSFAKGSGPYNDKGILDDDTIQFTSYHYYDIAVSAVTINATAIMASNTTVIPTQITLDGSVVRKCSEVNLVSQNKYVPC